MAAPLEDLHPQVREPLEQVRIALPQGGQPLLGAHFPIHGPEFDGLPVAGRKGIEVMRIVGVDLLLDEGLRRDGRRRGRLHREGCGQGKDPDQWRDHRVTVEASPFS